jgi:hypothetical protein
VSRFHTPARKHFVNALQVGGNPVGRLPFDGIRSVILTHLGQCHIDCRHDVSDQRGRQPGPILRSRDEECKRDLMGAIDLTPQLAGCLGGDQMVLVEIAGRTLAGAEPLPAHKGHGAEGGDQDREDEEEAKAEGDAAPLRPRGGRTIE